MSEWAPRRFWTSVSVADEEHGLSVRLDGRPVMTPAKTRLVVPSRALAEVIAAEWEAQEEKIHPATMPFTRMANSALDKVRPQRHAVADMLAAYAETDLLCYRADSPAELARRQAEQWDPLLDWAAADLGGRLRPVTGIMPAAQDAAALARLSEQVHALEPFTLAGFHDLVSLSGSLVIGLAALRQSQPVAALWDISQLDERWQQEQWGEDDEASAQAALRRQAFADAAEFCALLRRQKNLTGSSIPA